MDSAENPAFVFIHGAWHNHHTWDRVIPLLEERGYACVAIDLPGAEANAAIPAAFGQRPLDVTAFATEPSPNAGVTQAQRNEAALAAINDVAGKGNGKVVLVGHSLGGLTVSQLGEQVPDRLHSVVYLAALLLPYGMMGGDMLGSDVMSRSQVLSVLMADPEEVGVLRMDCRSEDPDYVARVKETFYGDVSDTDFRWILSGLHPDEPAQVTGEPSPITPENFGGLQRHYIRLLDDLAVNIEAQDEMIRLVDTQMGNTTVAHTLEASHSPFLSMPEALVDILVKTAA
jgi:pimeloyl-ACP methyl ester carboxylesterase